MYKIDVTHSKDLTFKVKSGGYELLVDAKGQGGMGPLDVLLSSLGTCMGVYIRKYAEGAKLNLEGFNIAVSAELSKEQLMCFRKINVEIDFKNNQIDERRKAALLAFIKNCPVHNTLKANPEVEIKLL